MVARGSLAALALSATVCTGSGRCGVLGVAPLHCVGVLEQDGRSARPSGFDLYMDLDTRRFCIDACAAAAPIQAVVGAQVRLRQINLFHYRDSFIVDSRTGSFQHIVINTPADVYQNESGTCRRERVGN